MSDYTKTKNYDLYLPVPNADNDVWGDHLNANTTTLDGLIKSVSDKSGVVTFNTRAGAVTLTTTDVTTVLPPGSSPPTMDGTASSGTATAWSRQDHVHPTDTTRAPLNSPIFTGVPVMPTGTQAVTQTAGTSNQTLATTAFVTTSLGAVPGGAVIAPTAPALNPGGLWWDSAGGQLYVRYDDGTSVAYVAATNVEGLANAATKAEVGAALNNSGRNLLHNGLFNVAQRGRGGFNTAGAYTVDRWQISFVSDTMLVQPFQSSDATRTQIGDEAVLWELWNSNFVGSAAAGASSVIFQKMEDVRRLTGKTVTVSFYARALTVLKLGVSLDQVFGSGGSPSATRYGNGQSVQLTTSWARYSLTFTLPSASGVTLGANNDDQTTLAFWYSSGSTNATRAGNVGVQSGSIGLWGVQLEIAAAGQTQPSPLDKPDPREDLANCQRFYRIGSMSMRGYNTAAAYLTATYPFGTTMRAVPSITLGTASSSNMGAPATAVIATDMVAMGAPVTASGDAWINMTFTASADL